MPPDARPHTTPRRPVRAVLLDRDGVLNVDRRESVTSVEALEVEPSAPDALRTLHDAGYALVVVTNQAWVGRAAAPGDALDALGAIDAELDRRLGGLVDDWFVCPHTDGDGCACRKPGTLLLERAQDRWGFEPADTWFVVDAGRDVEAARRFGCRVAIVRTGKGAATARDHPDLPAFDDVGSFAAWLTA